MKFGIVFGLYQHRLRGADVRDQRAKPERVITPCLGFNSEVSSTDLRGRKDCATVSVAAIGVNAPSVVRASRLLVTDGSPA